MKFLLTLLAITAAQFCIAQSSGPEDLDAAIARKLKLEITKELNLLKQQWRRAELPELEIEFRADTFMVEQFRSRRVAYEGPSTIAMTNAASDAYQQYDSLLNKYYKKLLAVLKEEDKKALVLAQKAWITFRDNELKLVDTMSKDQYSGGGTIQQLVDSDAYVDFVRSRVIALYAHLYRTVSL